MKKFIIVASLTVLAIPVLSFAQSSSSCGMPVNPATAADWINTISCLQSRISNLESRISALESRGISYPTTPGGQTVPIPSYPTTPTTPIGVPATPVIPSNGGATIPGGPIGTPATPIYGGATSVGTVQQGVTSDAVKAVQTFLRSAGTFNTAPTGYFGTVTKSAVQQFQAAQGLTQTGTVDQATLNKIQTLAPQVAPSTAATLQQVKVSQ
ncbi:MAG: peptidoglycan-binding domain-containing protein [Minisyncoccia bacterium]|jgi:hypothetical protein